MITGEDKYRLAVIGKELGRLYQQYLRVMADLAEQCDKPRQESLNSLLELAVRENDSISLHLHQMMGFVDIVIEKEKADG